MIIRYGIFPFVVIFLSAILSISGVELSAYYGAFSLVIFLILGSIFWVKFSWFYLFLSVFFILGNWLKISIHHIFEYDYIEPIGRFSGSEGDWISYYKMACIMGISLLFARLIDLVLPIFFRVDKTPFLNGNGAVSWIEWFSILCAAGIFYFFNNYYAFFVTGVNPVLILPFGLNAPMAFMALIGFPLVCAMYVSRDVFFRGYLDIRAIFVLLLVSLFASISMASRAAIVMQVLPVLVAAVYIQYKLGVYKVSIKPFVLFFIFLFIVLGAVSIYRIGLFTQGDVGDVSSVSSYIVESAFLFIDRWIGAEAIMVASSEPSASLPLFFSLLMEDPGVGVDAIYQVLSESGYTFLDELTFLTLPGYFGVLGLSGSLLFIFPATIFLVLTGIWLERVFGRLFKNQDIPLALVCAAMANSLTQISFPRLILPFLFQLLFLVIVLRYFSFRKMPGSFGTSR